MSKIKDLVIDELNDAADIIAIAETINQASDLLKIKSAEFKKKYGDLSRGSNNAKPL